MGSDADEVARLDRQAATLVSATDVLLRASGIEPGMRVLDLGTGLGHVALQVAALIGPTGAVVGVDSSAPLLALAEDRRAAAGADNVRFVESDVRAVRFDEPFDAIVTRLLLFHLPDAVDVLRHVQGHLRPGGTMVALDFDIGAARTEPAVELAERALGWIEAGFRAADASPRIGVRLATMLREAGFADVATFGIQPYLPAGSPLGAALMTSVLRSLSRTILSSGIATEAELGLDTLETRLARELEATGAVLLPPALAGAWGRL